MCTYVTVRGVILVISSGWDPCKIMSHLWKKCSKAEMQFADMLAYVESLKTMSHMACTNAVWRQMSSSNP